MLKSSNLFSFFLFFSSLQGCAAASRKAVSERYCLYVCILIVLLLILFVIFSLSFLLFIGQFFLGHPQLYGPNEALVKTYVEFQCEVPNHPINHEILLQIFKWVHSI